MTLHKRRKHTKGGGFFNTISKMAVHEKKDMSLPILGKYQNITKTLLSSKPSQQFFQVIYQYGMPNEINLDYKKNITLSSIDLTVEPHILINNMGKFLVALIEKKPFSRLLWLALYNLRSKSKTILSYLQPSPNPNEVRNYSFIIYSINDNTPIYSPIEMTTEKRKAELTNFIIYLQNNQQTIKPLSQYNKYFKVSGTGNGSGVLSLFNGVKLAKLAVANKPQKMEKMERMEKIKQ